VNCGLPELDLASRPEVAIPVANRKDRGLWERDCALLNETGRAEFGYFLCYFKMDAPRALVFRPLVKGNEALGTISGNDIEEVREVQSRSQSPRVFWSAPRPGALELWNNSFPETKILGLPVSRRMRALV